MEGLMHHRLLLFLLVVVVGDNEHFIRHRATHFRGVITDGNCHPMVNGFVFTDARAREHCKLDIAPISIIANHPKNGPLPDLNRCSLRS